jgi:hypothetical protein
MARVHHDDHAGEGGPGDNVGANKLLPVRAQRLRNAREAISGQIDQASRANVVEVDRLRATRSLAGEREALAADNRVDRAGLADVRAAGEGDFRRPGRRQLGGFADGGEELCLRE